MTTRSVSATRRLGLQPLPPTGGFTLIELMVVLVVVGILATVAYPAYSDSVRKARRADASDGSVAILQAQERCRANNATYTATIANLRVGSTTAGGYYTMDLASASATGYALSFTPVAAKGQSNDRGCSALSITVVSGNPTYAPAVCWGR